ncbi:MAG: hypothetical protein PVG78_03510 [Desulfobacterales bacterium]|jgi:DNA integrity scanning protein DisA with diadenylate cyclase activity
MEPISLPFIIDQMVSWRALVDILLLATGLFLIYRTLMRLGTWKIVVGVLAAILVYLFAALLDLRGTEWVFGNVSHVAVIALLVIFQPELRKIFERAVSMKRSEAGGQGAALARIVEEGAAVDAAAGQAVAGRGSQYRGHPRRRRRRKMTAPSQNRGGDLRKRENLPWLGSAISSPRF